MARVLWAGRFARAGLAPQVGQVLGLELGQVCQFAEQLPLEHAVGQRGPQRAGVAGHVGAAFGGGQVAALAGRFDQEAAQRYGVIHMPGKRIGAMGPDEAVRVVLGGQKQELDAARVAGVGQGAVQRLACGAPPRRVAVKAEHHGFGKAQQLVHVLGRAGRAQRGHGVREAQLRQGHHVHVALGDQGVARFADGGAGLEQAIQLAALVKDRGFGRVEVLGFVITQHPPAKANALALDVADREHHAVPKTVVAFATVLVVHDDQAGLFQQRVVVVRKHAGQAAPALGRVAQAVALGRGARDAASLEVGDGALGFAQLLAVGVACLFQHVGQRGLLLARCGGALLFLRGDVVVRHREAHLLRQVLHGLDKAHARVLHQEADGVAIFSATKAVIELFGGADAEGGRFLAMKGA